MYLCAVKLSQIEISGAASSEDEALLTFEADLVEQSEALDNVVRLIALSEAAFRYRSFVELAIVAAHLAHEEDFLRRPCCRVSGYAPCVCMMALLKT